MLTVLEAIQILNMGRTDGLPAAAWIVWCHVEAEWKLTVAGFDRYCEFCLLFQDEERVARRFRIYRQAA